MKIRFACVNDLIALIDFIRFWQLWTRRLSEFFFVGAVAGSRSVPGFNLMSVTTGWLDSLARRERQTDRARLFNLPDTRRTGALAHAQSTVKKKLLCNTGNSGLGDSISDFLYFETSIWRLHSFYSNSFTRNNFIIKTIYSLL